MPDIYAYFVKILSIMANKKLTVPHISKLSELDNAADIVTLLDSCGTLGYIDCANWADQFPYTPLSAFRIAHDGNAIYIDFSTRCQYLRAVNTTNQSPVSEDSCVEVFIDPLDNGHYWNFEFNCIGAINASHRSERANKTALTDAELAQVKRFGSCGDKPLEHELDGIHSWNLLVVIPLSLIGVSYTGQPLRLKANFYKCASKATVQHYLSWNRIETEKPDYHRPEFFGEIVLE
jgi:hypothetical protein